MSILKPQGIQTWLNVSGLSWVYTILQISINRSINRSINQSISKIAFFLSPSLDHNAKHTPQAAIFTISLRLKHHFLCCDFVFMLLLRNSNTTRILFGSNQYRIIQVADALQLEYLFETYIEKGPFASIDSDQCWDFIGQNIVPLSECHGLPARIIWH